MKHTNQEKEKSKRKGKNKKKEHGIVTEIALKTNYHSHLRKMKYEIVQDK